MYKYDYIFNERLLYQPFFVYEIVGQFRAFWEPNSALEKNHTNPITSSATPGDATHQPNS
jgi:hypothetical protein